MFDFMVPIRLTEAWNQAAFQSMSSAAWTLAALTEEAAVMWSRVAARTAGSGTTIAGGWPALGPWPITNQLAAVNPCEAWVRLFSSSAWISPVSGFRMFAPWPAGGPWLGRAAAWYAPHAPRSEDWARIMVLAILARGADMWLRPAVRLWLPLQPEQEPVRAGASASMMLPFTPPPVAAFAAYRSDSGFASAHTVLSAQIAAGIAFLMAAWPFLVALAVGSGPLFG